MYRGARGRVTLMPKGEAGQYIACMPEAATKFGRGLHTVSVGVGRGEQPIERQIGSCTIAVGLQEVQLGQHGTELLAILRDVGALESGAMRVPRGS